MSTTQQRRRLFAWTAGGVALLAAIAVVVPLTLSAPARAEIDGMVLSDAEIAIGIDRTGRAVQQAGGDDADVRARALDALRDDMALLQVARELGVTQLERPSDILDALDGVNAARAEAQNTGEVIYGPVEYTARTLYSKTLADVREATVQAARSSEDPRFLVDDAAVRARFEEAPEEWASAATTLTLTMAWTAEPDQERARTLLDEALRTGQSQEARIETMTVPDAELVDGLWNPDTAAAIRALDIGGLAGLEPSLSGWASYRLDARDVDGDAAFDRYRESIRGLLLDERLDAAIAAAKADQHVSD